MKNTNYNYIITAITIFIVIIFFSNPLSIYGDKKYIEMDAKKQQQIESDESLINLASIVQANQVSDTFRSLLFNITEEYIDKYINRVKDEKKLRDIFDLCNILGNSKEYYGWKSVKIAPFKVDRTCLITKDFNSLNEVENKMVESIKKGKLIDLMRDGEYYVIGVSLFDGSERSISLKDGCIKCHDAILKDRANKGKNRFKEKDNSRVEVEKEHVEGVVLIIIKKPKAS